MTMTSQSRWARRGARWALVAALAAGALGCPAPTGHTRDGFGGGFCSTTPYPYSYCANEGQTCSRSLSCYPYTDDCTCSGNTWYCNSSTTCSFDAPGIDVPPARCPGTPIAEGQFCGSVSIGLRCPGTTVGCDGSPFYTSCYCDGSNWNCTAPRCVDSGPRDVRTDAPTDFGRPPDTLSCPPTPTPGATCVPPIGCFYPRMADAGPCGQYCYCRADGHYTCELAACIDGGTDDASDVRTDTPPSDAAGLDAAAD